MGKKKQVIGFWSRLVLHFGWAKAMDALLEIRGGDKTAWAGLVTESSTITIHAKELFGGEKAEGGIEGDFDVMFGEPTQAKNAYLLEQFGPKIPAFRGKATGLFKGGLYGAFNPYPKALSAKLRRIFSDWPGDVCWYPEKAAVPMVDPATLLSQAITLNAISNGGTTSAVGVTVSDLDPDKTYTVSLVGGGYSYYSDDIGGHADGWYCKYRTTTAAGTVEHYVLPGSANAATALAAAQALGSVEITGVDEVTLWIYDTPAGDNRGAVDLVLNEQASSGLLGMNPAHMLYESVVSAAGEGCDSSEIDDANLRAAADRLYSEGFGLCTRWKPKEESVEQYQSRIERIIDGRLRQSRVDGKYRLTLIRDDYDLDALPILGDDDILEFRQDDSELLDAVNQVMVEWFDPEAKEKRITTPLSALAAIRAGGGVISEIGSYPEVPVEPLALRLAGRDLRYKSTPVKRFQLTTTRRPYAWLSGQLFRLQAPRRGIADMVCLLGDIGAGTPGSGSMTLKAAEHLAAMPSTVYVVGEPGVDSTPSPTPVPTSVQQLIEAPYVELVGRLGAADLAALGADSGFLLAIAKRPAGALNFGLWTAAGGEDLVQRDYGYYCPSALIVESADRYQTTFTLSDPTDLDEVEVGTAMLWGAEICRVDAIDAIALTVTLGRGCGDTVRQVHAAGERAWFYDANGATDSREYAAGEVAHAKLLTRTSSAELALADATELTVTMDERKARPYPPANLEVDGAAPGPAASESFTATWAHRDRLLQADQLVDDTAASIGPETNTRYTLQVINDATDAVLVEATDLGAPTADILLAADHAAIRLELWSTRDGLDSWQRQVSEPFAYTAGAAGASYAIAHPGSAGVINGTTPAEPDVPLQPYVEKTGDTMTGPLVVSTGADPASVSVDADAGIVKDVRWLTGLLHRWIGRSNGDAEAGANAGSNFEFHARADDGTFLGFVYTIARATRIFDFQQPPTIAGASLTTHLGLSGYATQADVAAAIAGLSWKHRVRFRTTANVSLASGGIAAGTTHDGITAVAGDRVLVPSQTAGAENGIYVVPASGAASRATDADSGAELVNAAVLVSEGTLYADKQFTCTTNGPITLGTTSIAWTQFSVAGDVAGDTHAATSKATPVDADEIPIADSAASFALKKLTWANLKATAKTYFDTLYQAASAKLLSLAGLSYTGNGLKVIRVNAGETAFELATVSGGSSGVVTASTYAARNTSPVSGELQIYTDINSQALYNGSSFVHSIGTEIVVPPILADFAWVNQGTSTISALGPFAKMTPQQTGSYNFRVQKKAVLAKPYNVELGIMLPGMIQGSDDILMGVGWRQSSSGRLVIFAVDYASSLLRVLYMNSATSASSAAASVAINRPIGLIKFRIREDATTLYADNYLGNGVWKNFWSASRTAWLTVSGADEVCWGMNMPAVLDIDSANWDHWKEY